VEGSAADPSSLEFLPEVQSPKVGDGPGTMKGVESSVVQPQLISLANRTVAGGNLIRLERAASDRGLAVLQLEPRSITLGLQAEDDVLTTSPSVGPESIILHRSVMSDLAMPVAQTALDLVSLQRTRPNPPPGPAPEPPTPAAPVAPSFTG
jgi:hypothetical protein